MSRMSKKRKEELGFFLNERNRMTYNHLCRRCIHACRQSFRSVVLECPHYHSKRSADNLPRGPDTADDTFLEGGDD